MFFMDFQNINRSCTCIVMSLFTGDLLVYFSLGKALYSCNYKVTVDNMYMFNCDAFDSFPQSISLSVQANITPVNVKIAYKASVASEMAFPCLLFKQNAGDGMGIYTIFSFVYCLASCPQNISII